MAIALETVETNIKPVNGDTETYRFKVGTGGVTAGHIVGKIADGVASIDGSVAATAMVPVGISLRTRSAGEYTDVVTHGPVQFCTGGAEGSEVYPVDGTVGAPTHTKSTKKWTVGVMLDTTIAFVRVVYVA